METEVIPIVVRPADFKKVQADVADKQKVIEKLQANLAAQEQKSVALGERIEILENVVVP